MWFKNLRIYRLTKPLEHTPEQLHELLQPFEFQPCGKLDPQRGGWVPPLGRHGSEFVHAANGYIMVSFKQEEKILPSAVVKDHLEQKVAQISEQEARHVGRKERDTLKDEIIFSLLPKAFTKSNICFAYIDTKADLLVVNASSAKRAEDLISALREALGSFPCVPLNPKQPPVSVMTSWLRDNTITSGLELGEECELTAPKDGRVIRCKNQDLTADEVLSHIATGMVVNKIAVIWKEGVQFIIDDQFAFKRLKFEEVIQEKAQSTNAESVAEEFDQEFAIMTVELAELIKDLVAAFGGLDTLDD